MAWINSIKLLTYKTFRNKTYIVIVYKTIRWYIIRLKKDIFACFIHCIWYYKYIIQNYNSKPLLLISNMTKKIPWNYLCYKQILHRFARVCFNQIKNLFHFSTKETSFSPTNYIHFVNVGVCHRLRFYFLLTQKKHHFLYTSTFGKHLYITALKSFKGNVYQMYNVNICLSTVTDMYYKRWAIFKQIICTHI